MKVLPQPKSVEISKESLKDFKAHVRSYPAYADFVRANPEFSKQTLSRIMNSRGKLMVSPKTAEEIENVVKTLKVEA